MISFKNFVDGIQNAVQAANDSLQDKNTGILDNYFMHSADDAEVLKYIDEAINASNSLTNKKGTITLDDFKKASEAMQKAKNALMGLSQRTEDELDDFGNLSPRVVTVEYPYVKEDGTIDSTDVQVPLITMTPISMSHIEEAKMKANFEMEIVDDELQMNFTSRERPPIGKRNKTTRGELEITIKPTETSEGLSQLIEGYERVLKSQIPH